MSRNLTRWAALYVWEKCINKELEFYAAAFDKLICIRNFAKHSYVAYFTVKNLLGNKKKHFAQYNVTFSPRGRRIISACLIYWTYDMKFILKDLHPASLIFDKRSEFSWIH